MDEFEDIFYGGDGDDFELADEEEEEKDPNEDASETSDQSDANLDFNTRFTDLATGGASAGTGTGTMEMVGTSRAARSLRTAEDNAIQKLYGVLSSGGYQKISETTRNDIVDRFSNVPNVNLYHTETLIVTFQLIIAGKRASEIPTFVTTRIKDGVKVTAYDVLRYYRKFGPKK